MTKKPEQNNPVLRFEDFEILVSIQQAISNPSETREALKALYGKYAGSDTETRENFETNLRKALKARMIPIQTFINR